MESEVCRLQRAVNLFTAQFEHERKEGLRLTTQIHQYEEHLRQLKSPLQPASTEDRRLYQQIIVLERQVDLLNTELAEIRTGNRELREKIDEERVDKKVKKEAMRSMKDDLLSATMRKEERSAERTRWLREDSSQKLKMNTLRCRSAQQTLRQRAKIQELEVRGRQTVVKQDVQLRDHLFRTIKSTFRLQIQRALESLDPTPVQTRLLRKWSAKLTSIKHKLEAYQRRIETLTKGLESIREISGFGGIDEVVTAIRRTEEQRRGLETHVNLQMSEIDYLEEVVNGVQSTISHRRTVSSQNTAEIESLIGSLKGDIDKVNRCREDLISKRKRLEVIMNNTFEGVRRLRKVLGEDWAEVNESSVLGCLTTVDASISELISLQSSLSGGSFLHLSSLQPKHFPASSPFLKVLPFTLTPDSESSQIFPKTEREMREQAQLDKRLLSSRPMTRR